MLRAYSSQPQASGLAMEILDILNQSYTDLMKASRSQEACGVGGFGQFLGTIMSSTKVFSIH